MEDGKRAAQDMAGCPQTLAEVAAITAAIISAASVWALPKGPASTSEAGPFLLQW